MSRKRLACWIAGALALACVVATPARAATLRWAAPPECPARDAIEAKLEEAVGKPLRDVYGVDFEVTIERQQAHKWRLRLQTRARTLDAEVRERELLGQNCAEVSEAGTLAIAMTLAERSRTEPGAADGANDGLEAPVEQPAPVPVKTAPAVAVAPSPEVDEDSPPPSAAETPLELSFAAMFVLDSQSLPSVAFGGSLEIALRYGLFKVIALGELFVPQEERTSETRAAKFGLAAAGGLLCLQPTAEAVSVLGCAGFELGQLSAEGRVADPNPGGSEPYRTLRFDLGGAYRFIPHVAGFVRLGVAIPLHKAEFNLDDMPIHELGPVSGRALLGVELIL